MILQFILREGDDYKIMAISLKKKVVALQYKNNFPDYFYPKT
jgi:uncharacterized protein YheU (UPF0270 family)